MHWRLYRAAPFQSVEKNYLKLISKCQHILLIWNNSYSVQSESDGSHIVQYFWHWGGTSQSSLIITIIMFVVVVVIIIMVVVVIIIIIIMVVVVIKGVMHWRWN